MVKTPKVLALTPNTLHTNVSFIAKQVILITTINYLPLGNCVQKLGNMTKINGSITGFTVCALGAGHCLCSYSIYFLHLPSQPKATFYFSALGLVALGVTVLPLAVSLPFLVCQLSYSLSSSLLSWPLWLPVSWLSLGFPSQPHLIWASWECQSRITWFLTFAAFLTPFSWLVEFKGTRSTKSSSAALVQAPGPQPGPSVLCRLQFPFSEW